MNRIVSLSTSVLLAAAGAWSQTEEHPAAATAITWDDGDSVVAAIVEHLRHDYVEAEVGRGAAQRLEERWAEGWLVEQSDGEALASELSRWLQEATGDGHLNVEYSRVQVDANAAENEEFAVAEMEKYYGAHINFGVQHAGRVGDNVGYLDLRVFPPLHMGGDTVVAAMNVIANTDALIIDLRNNGGGIGDTADLVASYLFDDGRQPLTGTYSRKTDATEQRFTQAFVPGQRFGGQKPVFVLISNRTFSAAEALAYNLQALGRAQLVGEVTGGGAHPFEYLAIHPHFVLWSVTEKSINPITNNNWQGVGVQPDIPAPAEDALDVALGELKRTSGASMDTE
ncbi:MAG: S41 family peptidase [Pseudomonadota bacterium]